MHNEQVDQARVFIYNILSLLFVEEHTKNNSELIVENLKLLEANAFDAGVAEATQVVLNHIATNGVKSIYDNYQELFLIPFGNHVSLSSSIYHEQREAGTMLVNVRSILAKTKIRRDENLFKAPEDHFGFIFTLCTYLIEEQGKGEFKEDLHKQLFSIVINPYIELLILKLQESKNPIYAPVSMILQNFIEFERAYLRISKAA